MRVARAVPALAPWLAAACTLLAAGCGRIGYQAHDAGGAEDAAVTAGDAGLVCTPACGLDRVCVLDGADTSCKCAPGLVELADGSCDAPLTVSATIAPGARRSFLEVYPSGDSMVHVVLLDARMAPVDAEVLRAATPVATGVGEAETVLELELRHAEGAHFFSYTVAYRELAGGSFETAVKENEATARALFEVRTFAHAAHPVNESLVYLPERYDADELAAFPVVLFLHGWGGAVNRNSAQELLEDDGLLQRVLLEEDLYASLPFILVAPHCDEDVQGGCWGWTNHTLPLAALDDALAAYRTDPLRVYVTGLSTGGQGTFELAARHPTRFAAAVPIASTYAAGTPICGALPVPVWAFHGDADMTQPASNTQQYLDALASGCGAAPVEPSAFTSVPCRTPSGNNHCGWIEAYDGTHGATVDGHTSVFDWMLARSL